MNSETKYVVDVMTPDPVVVGPDEDSWRAEQLAEARGVHDLLVIDEYALVGVVCLCELYDAEPAAPVSARMRKPITIEDQQTAEAAAALMDRCAVGCLPVVDWAGTLRGIVTRRDLVRAGVLEAESVRSCASCGSTHGLCRRGAEQPTFCLRCIEQTRRPRLSSEEIYFTLGGGD
jgi:CBS domain-containing protein